MNDSWKCEKNKEIMSKKKYMKRKQNIKVKIMVKGNIKYLKYTKNRRRGEYCSIF